MSQENVEIVLRAVEAFNREDLQLLAEFCAEDFVFVSVLTAVEAGGATYRGPESWESYFVDMHETWEEWQVENFRVFDGGEDQVVGVLSIVGKGKRSGVPVDREIGLVYTLRRGELVRMLSYLEPAEALAAAGLQE